MGRRKRSAHGEVHPMEQQQPGAIKLVFWTGPRSPTSFCHGSLDGYEHTSNLHSAWYGTWGQRRSWQVERTATGVREGNASNLCHERVGPASLASLLQHFHAAKPSWAYLGRAALAKFCNPPTTTVLCSCLSVIRFPAGWLAAWAPKMTDHYRSKVLAGPPLSALSPPASLGSCFFL
ncbi:hypothetical protein CC79DRAFT_77871 [Sarocladium strictum]